MRLGEIGFFLQGRLVVGEGQGPIGFFEPRPRRRPPVSCIMPTRGRLFPARYAIECFLRQTYPKRELVIVCASEGSEVERYVAELGDSRVRFLFAPGAGTVGEMRNFAIAEARGELICVWDDDDLSHPRRIGTQVAGLQAFGGRACLLGREFLWWPARQRIGISELRPWENTMLAVREGLPPYPALNQREDRALVQSIRASEGFALIDHPVCYVRTIHGGNICGDEHFDHLFSKASFVMPAERYENALRELEPNVPIGEFAADFARLGEGIDALPA